MKRTFGLSTLLIVAVVMVAQSGVAPATSEFSKEWKNQYLNEENNSNLNDEFKRSARKAGCYVCHVKGEKKTVRNEYGKATHKFLDKEKLNKDFIKANPEEAKKLLMEGFKKANELKSSDGQKFGDKIKNNELPATDAFPEK